MTADEETLAFATRHDVSALLKAQGVAERMAAAMGRADCEAGISDAEVAEKALPPNLFTFYQAGYEVASTEIHPHTRLRLGPAALASLDTAAQ